MLAALLKVSWIIRIFTTSHLPISTPLLLHGICMFSFFWLKGFLGGFYLQLADLYFKELWKVTRNNISLFSHYKWFWACAVSYIQAVPGIWHPNLCCCDVDKFTFPFITFQKGGVTKGGMLNSELSWKWCYQWESYADLKNIWSNAYFWL